MMRMIGTSLIKISNKMKVNHSKIYSRRKEKLLKNKYKANSLLKCLRVKVWRKDVRD